jgi:hypothetical protein
MILSNFLEVILTKHRNLVVVLCNNYEDLTCFRHGNFGMKERPWN